MFVIRTTVIALLGVAVLILPAWAEMKIPVLPHQKAAEKCCAPEQYTIIRGTTSGLIMIEPTGVPPYAVMESQDMAFDYKNNRVAANIYRLFYNGWPTQSEKMIQEDTTQTSVWLIDQINKNCSKVSLEDYPFYSERCISDKAKFGGSFYFGDKDVYADSWTSQWDYPSAQGTVTSTVIKKNGFCIPFGDTFVGTVKGWGATQQVVSTSGYLNYTQGIADPERYFKVPDYCH